MCLTEWKCLQFKLHIDGLFYYCFMSYLGLFQSYKDKTTVRYQKGCKIQAHARCFRPSTRKASSYQTCLETGLGFIVSGNELSQLVASYDKQGVLKTLSDLNSKEIRKFEQKLVHVASRLSLQFLVYPCSR